MKEFIFRRATTRDRSQLMELLEEVSLPYQDLSLMKQDFFLVEQAGRLAGCIGLQGSGISGLVRSLAVRRSFRGRGLARGLYERLVTLAASRRIKNLYLLTTTASRLFRKWGFRPFPRSKVPVAIRRTEEFSTLCPSSARCFKTNLGSEALFYPKDLLALESDVPGSRMWGIALRKAMLTYFEVRPGCRFRRHRHPSEQITLVLDGELFFQMDDRTILLRKGEAVAVPSNVPHAVYTKEWGAKAVDAWSPIMSVYK